MDWEICTVFQRNTPCETPRKSWLETPDIIGGPAASAKPVRAAMRKRHFRGQILLALAALVLLGLGTDFASSQQPPAPKPSPGNDPEAHLGRGYDALKQDQYDAAVSEFRAALKHDPTLTLR